MQFYKRLTIHAAIALAVVAPGSLGTTVSQATPEGTGTRGDGEPGSTTIPRAFFVENLGQWPQLQSGTMIRFQLRTANRIWWFTDDGLWLTVLKTDKETRRPGDKGSVRGVNLHLAFPDQLAGAQWAGEGAQPVEMNYFQGRDRSRWRANVPGFRSVRWAGVLPGADLVFSWADGELSLTREQSGVSPRGPIWMRVEGAGEVQMTADGQLFVDASLELGPLLRVLMPDHQPALMSVSGDTRIDTTISLLPSGGNALSTSNSAYLSLILNSYDSPLAATDLLYSTFLGGSGDDAGYGLQIGADGSIYVTGFTNSVDIPTTPGAFDTSFQGGDCPGFACRDAYVAKLAPGGGALVYATYLGGVNDDYANDIAVAGNGTVYVAGYTSSTDFPTTPGAFDSDFNGGRKDVFVTALDPSGSSLVYSTFVGGGGIDECHAIALNTTGEVYLTGLTNSTNYPTTPGAFDEAYNGNPFDTYVTRLNAAGTGLLYSTFLGGQNNDIGNGIALTSSGQALITGSTHSVDFPTTPGAFQRVCQCTADGPGDAFVTALTIDGNALIYGTFLGGSADDRAHGIAVLADSSTFVTGSTTSTDFPTTPGAFDNTYQGGSTYGDAYLVHLNATGSSVISGTYLGGSADEFGVRLVVGQDGAVTMTGYSLSTDFPTTPRAFDVTYNGGSLLGDVFVTRVDSTASTLLYSTYLGGSEDEEGHAVVLSANATAFVAGWTTSVDFPSTTDAFDSNYHGGPYYGDMFISKMSLTQNEVRGASKAIRPHHLQGGRDSSLRSE